MWLNIIAATGQSVGELLKSHWETYGRNYYSRHDFEAIPTEEANAAFDGLIAKLPDLIGESYGDLTVSAADEFSYTDPVDGSVSHHQGIRVIFGDGGRFVLRKSGTGTTGATLRLYLEALEQDPDKLAQDPQAALGGIIAAAHEIIDLKGTTGREKPDVIT